MCQHQIGLGSPTKNHITTYLPIFKQSDSEYSVDLLYIKKVVNPFYEKYFISLHLYQLQPMHCLIGLGLLILQNAHAMLLTPLSASFKFSTHRMQLQEKLQLHEQSIGYLFLFLNNKELKNKFINTISIFSCKTQFICYHCLQFSFYCCIT